MTSSLTSSKGRDKPRSDFASADVTLTLSGGSSVVNVCAEPMERVLCWAPMGFFSGQGMCVLCQQPVVRMSRYTQALGARSHSWSPCSVSMDKKGGGQSDGDR